VKRSRDRTDRITLSRKKRKVKLARTVWEEELDRRAIFELEANGIQWSFVERWLDAQDPSQSYLARRFVKHVLQVLADDEAPPREQNEVHNELYRRLISAGIAD